MKFWAWVPDDGEKPEKPTFDGRTPEGAACMFVNQHWSDLDHPKEVVVRVDDECGHRYEFKVTATKSVSFHAGPVDG